MSPDTRIQTAVEPAHGPRLDFDPRERVADLESIYLDGTLVLVGCGKAKRDPSDPTDLHLASVGPDEPMSDLPGAATGPAWPAKDLYTSPYFGAKRDFAEVVTQWAAPHDGTDTAGWAILSAEHAVVEPWQDLQYYDTSVDDLGADPTNPDHRVTNAAGRRRPDGQEIVTEMDAWAASVATSLAKWLAGHRDRGQRRDECRADTLLVLAGQSYLEPLKERGVFEYGIARMAGDPNEGYTLPVDVRFLFENIPAGGNGEQMGWLSDAVSRLEPLVGNGDAGDQRELGAWTGAERTCEDCGVGASDATLREFDGAVFCEDCEPVGRCNRCVSWTHDTGLGSYPLCPDCQTESGGQIRDPIDDGDATEQATLTDGGEP